MATEIGMDVFAIVQVSTSDISVQQRASLFDPRAKQFPAAHFTRHTDTLPSVVAPYPYGSFTPRT